ncbi:MAG: D-2-hydroxyacid dehydrogenase [Pseudomonadota bacterium]
MPQPGSVLILHEDAAEARVALGHLQDTETLIFVDRPEAIESALWQHDPEAVFTLKAPGMPGAAMRPVMEHSSVRLVYVGGSGYDHLLPLDNGAVTLTNAAGVLAAHLAETVTGAMLALNGHFLHYAAQAHRRVWQPRAFRPIAGQTLLVVGLGHIGACVARNAAALGMRVIATRRTPSPHPAVDAVYGGDALEELLPEADVVSVHLRLTPETRHLFNDGRFALMRDGSLFLNTARGGVVDEPALARALSGGRVRGAYLDVFETEPLPNDSPLWSMANVLLTPHTADNVHGWRSQLLAHFADTLHRWRQGQDLPNRVTP